MTEKLKVNVLGTEYEIIQTDEKSEECDGYIHFENKKIFVMDLSHHQENASSAKGRVIRHELVHAFLYESGLDANSEWAQNEEVVDWIALQFPKIVKVFEELEVTR